MSKRESRRGGSSQRARVRGEEGDFFSSCKPFQLCSGLRTEAWERGGKKKSNWECVALCFILTTESGEGRRQRKGRERALGLSAGPRGKTLTESLDWSWEGCLGLCPLDTVPRLTALPCTPACLPGWPRIQPSAPPPPSLIYPQMPSFTPASPPPSCCLLSIYCTSPLELWMIRGRKQDKSK